MPEVVNIKPPTFTDRQRQVVELIAAGSSNEEVGRALGISTRTAKAHTDVLRRADVDPEPLAGPEALRVAGRQRPVPDLSAALGA